MSVLELQSAISQLSEDQYRELSTWLAERTADNWDAQIERDSESGQLDKLLARVDAEIAAGQFDAL